jgi:uncharacterized protein
MATTPVCILLPPSEGKAAGGVEPPWDPAAGRFPTLAEARADVAEALAGAVTAGDEASTAKLLGVRGEHLERAVAADRALVGAPTMPAAARYQGVVHLHIGLDTLTATARRRASAELVVVSAVLGAVGLDDPAPDYRLKMGASLGGLGRLSRWWRPALAEVLDPLASDGGTVVDLLAAEQADAWTFDGPGRIRVRFEDAAPGGGTRRASGHAAKAVKGRLARHLVGRGRTGVPRALAAFAADGWEWDDAASDLRPTAGRSAAAVYVRR